jgi:hypothetical protein
MTDATSTTLGGELHVWRTTAVAYVDTREAGAPKGLARVNDRVVETEFVFDRHAATDLSVAYAILVPQRRVRIERAGVGA